jgi:hypothetical protein
LSPPATRRATVEVFDPTSTREHQSYVTTDGQSASLSSCQAPILGLTIRFVFLSDRCRSHSCITTQLPSNELYDVFHIALCIRCIENVYGVVCVAVTTFLYFYRNSVSQSVELNVLSESDLLSPC